MYPINNASPQRVAIGAVVQISDGAVQTSGVSVKVLPQGTTASAGGGTIAYEEGVVHYLPTQAETNYASFILIAYKTGCIPATVTVVTSASGTAGHAGLDWGIVINKTTTHNLSATTIKTATDVETDTADIQSRIPAALVSGRIDASVGAMAANVLTATAINADAITAAKVAADVTTEIQTGLATAANLAIVAGYLDTEIAAIKAKTDNLPAAPAATGDIPTATQNADALLNRDMSAVSDTNARSPLNALRFLRNKWDIAGTALTVKKEDDSTTAWTATVTAAPGADPISGNDPA